MALKDPHTPKERLKRVVIENAVCQSLPDRYYLWSIFSFVKPSVVTVSGWHVHVRRSVVHVGSFYYLTPLLFNIYIKNYSMFPGCVSSCVTLPWGVSVLWNISETSAERPVAQWKMAFKLSVWVRCTHPLCSHGSCSFESTCKRPGSFIYLFICFWSALSSMFVSDLRVDDSVLIKSDRADC